MKEYICHAAQKGFYAGPVHAIRTVSAVKKTSSDIVIEIAKLDCAIEEIESKLSKRDSRSGENDEIMGTVGMMLDDDAFIGEIKQYINDENCNAEYAVKVVSDKYAKEMEKADSEYLRARASDIDGLGKELIRVMSEGGAGECEGSAGEREGGSGERECGVGECVFALAAPEISPAQLASYSSKMIGGIVTDKGSPNSHLSILAGNLSVPYVYGNKDAVAKAMNSEFIIIDDDRVIIDPDEKTKVNAIARMKEIVEENKRQEEALRQTEGTMGASVCKTKIYANIEGPDDIPKLLESGADGVGLFRTEFLFMERDAAHSGDVQPGSTQTGSGSTPPSEEEQYEAYKAVLTAMGKKEVIIRTMDIGSDKKVSWLKIPDESNPALGLRGARVSLERKGIFKTQIRALLRAGVYGNLKIMFPMIASDWEIDEITCFVKAQAADLEKENIAYKIPEMGIMIETPAAAMTADILAGKAAFFSIGTNDLTQYTLALDREAQGLDRFFNPHHEAVLRLVEATVQGGHKRGIPTGICGQLAADSDIDVLMRLIAAGVDELSVPISKVKKVRANVAKAEAEIGEKAEAGADANAEKIGSPADGTLIPMNEIPDSAFSSGTLGKCVGILPDNGNIWAPCDGTITGVTETKHAVTMRSDAGNEYLIHVGIDTVKLSGKGFNVLVKEGERVSKSQKIMEADLDVIKDAGFSPMVIIVKL